MPCLPYPSLDCLFVVLNLTLIGVQLVYKCLHLCMCVCLCVSEWAGVAHFICEVYDSVWSFAKSVLQNCKVQSVFVLLVPLLKACLQN